MSMTIDQVIQRLAKGDTKGLTEEQISNAVQAMQTAKSGAPTFVVRPGAYGGTVLEFKVDGGRPVSHGAKTIGQGQGVLGQAAGWLADKVVSAELQRLSLILGQETAEKVARILVGEAPTEENINKALKRIGQPPVPKGSLDRAQAGPQTAGPQGGYRIERPEGGIPKMVGRGEPESAAERFAKQLEGYDKDIEKFESRAQVADASASNLENYMLRRPNADASGMKKMIAARRDEAKRMMAQADAKKAERLKMQTSQMELKANLQSGYSKYRQTQMDSAFDAIQAAWKTARTGTGDFGRDEYVQTAMRMLVPYIQETAQKTGAQPQEVIQAWQEIVNESWDDPSKMGWLRYSLEGGQ